ncbi:zinc-ribbon domain-containing protein [Halolamina sp.]|jgi:rubrerythrin|uniref:zinc-ribbon domain-containing protein n=1 Tax=Halolamina sp. TaxID=1940283 RepID=UPI000223BC01|nr:CopG-like domain-containing protein DNA-binding domain [halophilic archaeon DL31]
MSKITFRADDALVERLDDLDASKSEVMREALREFLDRQPGASNPDAAGAEGSIAARVDKLLADRLDGGRDVNLTISLEGAADATVAEESPDAATETSDNGCQQCGQEVDDADAFCPNCGAEREQQAHCECGEAVDQSWTFCPGCGRRSPTADVFDRA